MSPTEPLCAATIVHNIFGKQQSNDVIDTSGSNPLPDLGYPGLFPADDDPFDDRDIVDGGAGIDTITTGDEQDQIFGGTGEDTIDAGIDDDTIFGEDGNDRIVGGEGNDTISGGAGDDTIYGCIDPDLGLPDNLDVPDDGTGPFRPDLVPNNGMDVVSGGNGNDTIFGADDDDVLSGDAGYDFIDGGFDDEKLCSCCKYFLTGTPSMKTCCDCDINNGQH